MASPSSFSTTSSSSSSSSSSTSTGTGTGTHRRTRSRSRGRGRSRSRSRSRAQLNRGQLELTPEEMSRGVTEAMIAQSLAGSYAAFITGVIPTLVMALVLYSVVAAAGHFALLSSLFPAFPKHAVTLVPALAPLAKLLSTTVPAGSPLVIVAGFVPIFFATVLLKVLYRRNLASNAAIVGHAVMLAVGVAVLLEFGVLRPISAETSGVQAGTGAANATANATAAAPATPMSLLDTTFPVDALWSTALYLAHATFASTFSDLVLYCHHYIPLRRWQYTHIVALTLAIVAFPHVKPFVPALPTASSIVPASSPVYAVLNSVLSHQLTPHFVQFLVLALASVPAQEAVKSLGLFFVYAYAPSILSTVVIISFIVVCSFGSLVLWLYGGVGAPLPEMLLLFGVAWLMVKNLVKANEEPRWKGFGSPMKTKKD